MNDGCATVIVIVIVIVSHYTPGRPQRSTPGSVAGGQGV